MLKDMNYSKKYFQFFFDFMLILIIFQVFYKIKMKFESENVFVDVYRLKICYE